MGFDRVREVVARVGGWLRRDELERDFEEEVASHLAMAADELERGGASPEEARRQARARFGGRDSVREQHRDARGLPIVDQTLLDLRYAFRMLRRAPGFAAVAVASLGAGIGLNTAIFSVVDGVLLRRAPVEDLDRLVMVWETDRVTGTTREPASFPDYLDFQERASTFSALAAVIADERNLTSASGDPVRLAALGVTGGLLPMLGVRPTLGRPFLPREALAGAPNVVLISESVWSREFDRTPDVVGRTVRLDDVPYEIVGVVPDATDFGVLQILSRAAYSRSFADRGAPVRVDVWTPLQATPETLPRSTHPIFVVGRLAPRATVATAQAELAEIAAGLEAGYPENAGRGVFVEPLGDVVFGPVRPALLVLWGAVGLVLLVACVNVASLLLARGTARAREIAIRAAIGSSAWRLARQFAVETTLITLIAAGLGVALAHVALVVLVAQAPADIPRLDGVGIDVRVLGLTAAVSILVGLTFGLVPTLQALRVDPQTTLKGEAGRSVTGGRGTARAREALVIAEMALAVVLVAGAGLLIRSVWELRQVDAGFSTAGVLKAEYQLPRSRYPVDFEAFPNFAEQHAFTRTLLERAATMPGVRRVAVAGNHPLDPGFTNSFSLVGRDGERLPEISIRRVTGGYFETVGLGLRRGRLLTDADDPSAPPVAVVNEAAVERLLGDRDPLGARIAFWGAQRTIVGVVGGERFHGIAEAPPIAVYLPLWQAPSVNGAGVLLVNTARDPAAVAPEVRATIRGIDPGLAVFGLEPLDDTLARSIGERRFTMLLLAGFASMALFLAAIGVHGVLSYSVARRTPEIGIRMALGAEPGRVRRLIVREGLTLAAAGVVLGLIGSLVLTRLLQSLLYGVTPTDPATFALVALTLGGVALLACAAPVWKATQIDPIVALREEG
jgi:putative ABC transport system permease protein